MPALAPAERPEEGVGVGLTGAVVTAAVGAVVVLDAIEVLVDVVGAAVWLVVLLMIVEEEDGYATSNPGLDTVSVDSDTSSADRS